MRSAKMLALVSAPFLLRLAFAPTKARALFEREQPREKTQGAFQASTQARRWLMLDNLDLRSATACDREQLLIGQRCDGDVVIVLH